MAVGGFSLTGNIFAISNAVEKALIADNLGYEILLFPKANEIDFLNYYKQSKEALKLKDNLIFAILWMTLSLRPFPFALTIYFHLISFTYSFPNSVRNSSSYFMIAITTKNLIRA